MKPFTPQTVHAKEVAFFDKQASQAQIGRLDPGILKRYIRPGMMFPREFMHRLAGDITGKRVLDIGCGEGQDALLLSRLGADVTGVDISPGAIEAAMRRLQLNNACAEFTVAAVEDLPESLGQFEIVWVEALLHHVTHDLEPVLRSIKRRVSPGGMIIMSEPVNLIPSLRSLRMKIGPKVYGTPDERPLNHNDLKIIRQVFPGLKMRRFRTLGRINRLVLNGPLETAPTARKLLVRTVAGIDYILNAVPGIRDAASVSVMWWRAN